MDRLADVVSQRPVVLDGGLATRLEARGHDLSSALWSAGLLLDDPDEVEAAHRDFFAAGAEVVVTSSYQVSFDGLAARGISAEGTAEVLRRSVEVGRRAAAGFGDGHRWVVASVGPYGASLADGSEYRGRYGLSVRELIAFHQPRLHALVAAEPDLLALETVPDVDEGIALVTATAELGVPAWLSYTISGHRTRAGQPLEDAFAVATDADHIVAVGVNCCAPDDVPLAIGTARAVTGKPVIVYPNSGEGWNAQRRSWTGPSRFAAAPARQWLDAGARIVGGCCRVRPADIAALSRAVHTG